MGTMYLAATAAGKSSSNSLTPILIIAVLFGIQHRGTERVGRLFAPIMVVWFVTMGVIGASHVLTGTLETNAGLRVKKSSTRRRNCGADGPRRYIGVWDR